MKTKNAMKKFLIKKGFEKLLVPPLPFDIEKYYSRKATILEMLRCRNLTLIEIDKIFNKLALIGRGVTLESQILKYGEKIGKEKFDAYREKQAFSNTFEYKAAKYGITEEEFKKYNKSRAVTLENLIKKHGKEKGEEIYKSYCEKQAFTNTKEYLGDRYEKVNKKKAHTLDNYIRLYGEEVAEDKLKEFFSSSSVAYSKISQELFWKIYEELTEEEKAHTYFGELNKEYVVVKNKKVFKYDFVCSSLKLCIEFHGDHYHGNPAIYKPDQTLKGKGQNTIKAKEAWKKDEIKEETIKISRGYRYIMVWEGDYLKNKPDVVNKILDVVDECRIQ